MVRLVGGAESGELLGMAKPVEVAAVDDDAAHLCGHTVHILCGGVGDDVGAPLEGTAVDGGGEGVVDNQGHAVLVGDACELLNVEHGAAGVGDGLAEERLCVWAEGCLNLLLGSGGRHEGALDAELLHRHAEEVVGAAVNLVRGDEVVASLTDVEQGVEVGSLARRCQHGAHAAFEGCNFGSHGVVRRVLQAGVEVALLL